MTSGNRRNGGKKGFRSGATLVQGYVQKASEERGFALARLLTHWDEVVGDGVAQMCQPARVSYPRSGLGTTLTLNTTGATAPMVQAQSEAIRNSVNACYGYNAVSRIRIAQVGTDQLHPPKAIRAAPNAPSKAAREQAKSTVRDIRDASLRQALEDLGGNILTQPRTKS